jgi:hypothetical protein
MTTYVRTYVHERIILKRTIPVIGFEMERNDMVNAFVT